MPHLMFPCAQGGPLIDLFVGVSAQRKIALTAAKVAVPGFQLARALIDTGASATCIDPTVLKPLGLTPTGTATIHTPSTAGTGYTCEQFDVAIGIYHPSSPMLHPALPVIATDLKAHGFTALIGRDVLSSCLFIYDGSAKIFTIAF